MVSRATALEQPVKSARTVSNIVVVSVCSKTLSTTEGRRVERSTAHGCHTISSAPTSLTREDGIVEAMVWSLASTCSICEWDVARERNVVEAKVPDGSVHHAICRESEDSTDDTACNNVIPVVKCVDGEGAADESCAEDGGVDGDQFPHTWVVVGEDLEFAIEVERQENKAGEGCSGVA